MIDQKTIKNVLMGLGVPEDDINRALPTLLGIKLEGGHGILLSISEATQFLKVSRWTLNRAVKSGVLPCVKIGRRVLFKEADLWAYAESNRGLKEVSK